jgi:hypothetical protein
MGLVASRRSTEPAADGSGPHTDVPRPALLRRLPGWLVAGLAYLVVAVVIWWHVWTGGPASSMVCECGDPSSFVWYLAWPAYAISHGHGLFLATTSHFPAGINLVDNTSVLAVGVPLAPVTWLFGPVATLNVAATAAPALTGLASYGFLRGGLGLRWTAAFLGGLLFGFSPYVLHHEAVSHLQLFFLALLPLIFWACYELVIKQAGRWWPWAALLGLSVTAQFFVSTEILTIVVLIAVLTLACTVLAALWHDRRDLRHGVLASRLPDAARGLGAGTALAAVLLAYPFVYAVTGPQHIKGAVWAEPSQNGLISVLLPLKVSAYNAQHLIQVGYLGTPGALPGYVGVFALAVLLLAAITLRRPLVLLCAVLSVASIWLSLGARSVPLSRKGEPGWLPLLWRPFENLPVLDKLAPQNFVVPALWFTVVAGAVLVDRLLDRGLVLPARMSRRLSPRLAGAAAAVLVSAALVVPWLLSWPLPYATRHVTVSAWADKAGRRLPAASVVLYYPYPATYQDQALVWQAQTGMPYSVVGGRGIVVGPGGTASHGLTAGTPEALMGTLLSSHAGRILAVSQSAPEVRVFRAALRHWRVTEVVITTGAGNPVFARRWLTAVLRSAPVRQDGAWVWANVQQLVR